MISGFLTASILAAFLGGAIAFFAPCCITFLLPAYFAFALKEKKQILKMTLVFMLGLATVLLPIGLGLAGLGQLASQFHSQIFIAGGLFLVLVGVLTLAGRSLAMPFKPKPGNLQKLDVASVYQLGLFSGFASSCCLPVLAGVMTLSLLSASFVQAFILGWAYVLGMVIPLIVIALSWEKFQLNKHSFLQGKMLHFRVLRKSFEVHSTSLFSGLMLILIGLYTLLLAFSNQITASSDGQIALAVWLQGTAKTMLESVSFIPDWVFLVLLVLGVGWLILRVKKSEIEQPKEGGEKMPIDPICGMTVAMTGAPTSNFNGKTYFFCSSHCKQAFDQDPKAFVKG